MSHYVLVSLFLDLVLTLDTLACILAELLGLRRLFLPSVSLTTTGLRLGGLDWLFIASRDGSEHNGLIE